MCNLEVHREVQSYRKAHQVELYFWGVKGQASELLHKKKTQITKISRSCVENIPEAQSLSAALKAVGP